MLAILKTRSVFILIDSKQLKSRTVRIYKSIKARFALVLRSYASLFSNLGISCFVIDESFNFNDSVQSLSVIPLTDTRHERCLRTPTYVIFTSGSTSELKGIVEEHLALSISV